MVKLIGDSETIYATFVGNNEVSISIGASEMWMSRTEWETFRDEVDNEFKENRV